MRSSILLLGALAMGFGISCESDASKPLDSKSWSSVHSSWGDPVKHDADSETAKRASAFYAKHVGLHSSYKIAHFEIYLYSVTNNVDGTQTWTYAVTKTADGPSYKDLSHWDLDLATCASSNIADFHGGSWGPDPAAGTCVSGDVFKWNWGFSYGDTEYYTLTTDKWYAATDVTAIMKFGTTCETGTIPGPDCTTLDDGESDDDCPKWVDTLVLDVSITYSGYHGYNHLGFPIYYIGETMYGDLEICNPTGDTIDNLTITAIQEMYPGGYTVPCSSPVESWSSVTIAPYDCIVLENSFYLASSCPWGNYQTHVVIEREGDDDCPEGILLFEDKTVGIYDPPTD